MPEKPAVTQIPSPHFGYPTGAHGRGGEGIVAIVDHIMGGTLTGCDAWFSNPAAQVSAHFGVGRNGAIHQYVQEADAAWGAGGLNLPDPSLPWLSTHGSVVNQRVISIEHEGQPGQAFTPEQITATIALHRYLVDRWNIPVDRDHIVGHYRLDSVNRKSCPGPAFPWDAVFAAFGGEDMPLPLDRLNEVRANLDVLWGNVNTLEPALKEQIVVELRSAIVNIKKAVGLPD